MTVPLPVCACCLDPIGLVWRVTVPRVYVICGSGGCEQWAWAQGLRYWGERQAPAVSRRHKTCAGCGGDLPRRTRDRFSVGDRFACSLTCMQAVTARERIEA